MRFAKEQNFEILQKGALETFYALESWMEWNKTQHGGPESSGIKAKVVQSNFLIFLLNILRILGRSWNCGSCCNVI